MGDAPPDAPALDGLAGLPPFEGAVVGRFQNTAMADEATAATPAWLAPWPDSSAKPVVVMATAISS